MASDYVDMINLTQFRVQLEAVVKTAINMQVQQTTSNYKIVKEDSGPSICTDAVVSQLCYRMFRLKISFNFKFTAVSETNGIVSGA